MKVNLKYKMGQRIKTVSKIYTIIGFEYTMFRPIRYCLLHMKDSIPAWDYFYEQEIELLRE